MMINQKTTNKPNKLNFLNQTNNTCYTVNKPYNHCPKYVIPDGGSPFVFPGYINQFYYSISIIRKKVAHELKKIVSEIASF